MTNLGAARLTRSGRRGALTTVLAVVFTVALLALPVAAAPGDGSGGGGAPDDNTGSVYADLVIVLRDEHGAPVLKKYEVPATEESEAVTEYCVQPVSYTPVPGLEPTPNPVDGRQVWVLPLQGEWIESPPDPPVAEIEVCDPWPQYAMFVSEVELERLNMSRTDDSVLAQKLADVQEKFFLAETITLDMSGRIRLDDKAVDAPPENQAMYEELMLTGTLPGLRNSSTSVVGPPAAIGPAESAGSNSRFDAWELAAMMIGAAASKSTPLTVDAVEYYNRIIGFPPVAVPPYESSWEVEFVRSTDPDDPTVELADSERLVDYRGFTYNRSETFKGSVTWLDVPSLQWRVSKIVDLVPFTNLSGFDEIGERTLTGITAFAQLADDVRALCNFVPDNTFIPGFYMDPPGIDTTDEQLAAITNPAVDLGTLPEDVFQTFPFQVTLSLLNPWGGTNLYTGEHWGGSLIDTARLRITVDADDAFTGVDVAATSASTETPPSQPVPFTVNADGDLVGWWGPDIGFAVPAGYNVSTTFDAVITDAAPTGEYRVTLELVDVDDPATTLAAESGSIHVNANVPTVLWGTPLPKLATQANVMQLPLVVYAPEAGAGVLDLTITGPGDDPLTAADESLAVGDVRVYGSDGLDMVPMSLALVGSDLVGEWDVSLLPGYNPVRWYITVVEGAAVGNYAFGVALEGRNVLESLVVAVAPPAVHGQQPGAFTVSIDPVEPLGSTATFNLAAAGDTAGVIFQCKLERDGEFWMEHGDELPATEEEEWRPCQSPKTYTGLPGGSWEFFLRGARGETLSPVASVTWTVAGDPGDPGAFRVFIEPVQPLGSDATFVLAAEGDTTGMIFQCKLEKDGELWQEGEEPPATEEEAWKPCQSPKTYTDLPDGSYEFFLRGKRGEVVSTVKSVTWTVPYVTLSIVPTQLGANPVIAFTADGDTAGVAFECALETNGTVGAWTACTSPATFTGLADGSYELFVRGSRGGVVAATGSVTWTVTTAPVGGGGGGDGGFVLPGGNPPAVVGVTRAEGADRFDTAAGVSERFFPDGASVAVVVTGDAHPDAVVAGPLAKRLGGPVLLTHRDTLPVATAVELARLAPDEVIVVGGTAAISDATIAVLEQLTGRVTRVAGADRYATAAAVSARYFDAGTAHVFVATGEAFPDALAAGGAAGALGGPVLLTRSAELPAVTEAELDRLAPATVHVVGGTAAIGAGVADRMAEVTGAQVLRHAGSDRYGTAAAVAELFVEPSDVVLVATGRDYPDALAGSALGRPLLLVDDTVDDATERQLLRLGTGGVVVLGGSAAVPDSVMGQLLP